MLGSLPGPLGHWGGKFKYSLNILGKLEIPPKLIALVFFSALLLSNFTTCPVNLYEERLAKQLNTFLCATACCSLCFVIVCRSLFSF